LLTQCTGPREKAEAGVAAARRLVELLPERCGDYLSAGRP
jgi:hypothetical protein